MQALTIWHLNSFPFPNLEFAPNFCSVARSISRNPCISRGFRVGDHLRNTSDDLVCGGFSRYSSVKFYAFFEPKRHSIGPFVPLALEYEEQAAVCEEDSGLEGELFEEEEGDVEVHNGVHSERVVQQNDLSLGHGKNGTPDEAKPKDEGRERGEKVSSKIIGKRIDIRALAWSLRAAKSADDVEMVLKDIGDIPLQVYSSVLRWFGKNKRVDSAIALVEWLKGKKQPSVSTGPNIFIFNSLLGALKQAEQFELTEKIVRDMSVEGITPNTVTYNILMGICLAQGRETEALNLFKEMQAKGLSPSASSYSTALLAYRRIGDGFGALEFYVDFRNKYQNGELGKIDENEDWDIEAAKLEDFVVRICYQVMRRWLVQKENLSSKVFRLLTSMDQIGLHTDRILHERLIWACTHENQCLIAKELYNRIRERSSEISLSVCNHVIWLLGKGKKWWAALEIYEELLEKGPKPNNMSYELVLSHFNFLLAAAKKKGIWRWGVRLLNRMEEKGLKPDSNAWNSVLVACSKASETSAAVQIFKRMVEKGEKPTVISYGALLSALEKGKLYDEALRVWNHMVKVGVESNSYIYTIMASIYAAQGKFNMVESVIREMPVSGVELNVIIFNAIITACARNNMGGAAYEWFQRMEVESIKPNEVTYEMLIEALAKDGKPRLACDFYLRSQLEGLSLSSKAYDAVAESSQANGATIDLSLLGPRPPEKKKKVQIRKNLSDFCHLAGVPRRSKPFDREELFTHDTKASI